MWPVVVVDDFLTLVNEGLSHAEELSSRQLVVPVCDMARLVLDASHFEELNLVGCHCFDSH